MELGLNDSRIVKQRSREMLLGNRKLRTRVLQTTHQYSLYYSTKLLSIVVCSSRHAETMNAQKTYTAVVERQHGESRSEFVLLRFG